jgi:molybdate transport system regulatory protein
MRNFGPSKKMARLQLTLVLASGARIGPGKAALLKSVRETGSISGAARAMDMDYKRAWLLIDSINRAFNSPVVERNAGGVGGGGAILTPLGHEVLERYGRLEAAAQALAKADLKALERKAAADIGPKV